MFRTCRAIAGALTLLAMAGVSAADVPVLKDPTRPLRSTASAGKPVSDPVERPTLESVLIGGGRRFAIINGSRMAEGDERHGVKVLEIRPGGVVVSVNGSSRVTLEITNSRMHKERR